MYKKILNNKNLPVTTILAKELLTVNEDIHCYGLRLTTDEAISIIEKRNQSLEDNGRLEFNNVLIKKLIIEFASSGYITQDNYAETIYDLIDIFYFYKNETYDKLSDDELIAIMRDSYDNECEGSLELLQCRTLDNISHDIKDQVIEGEHTKLQRGINNEGLKDQ